MAADQNFLSDLRSGLNTSLDQISVPVSRALASQIPVSPVTAASGAQFSAMYVFGDSLSDTGNVSLATAGLIPVSPPYADRSFTNGQVWAQDLAQSIGLPSLQPSLAGGTDFAYGGADTGQTSVHTTNGTDLTSQYDQFAAQVSSPQTNALYAIWIGSNDVLDIAGDTSLTLTQQQAAVSQAVNNETFTLEQLAERGARNFVVLNVPDLGATPYETARGSASAASASSLAQLYNAELSVEVQSLQATGVLKIDLVDTYSALDQAINNPSAYGFQNTTDPVWTGNVSSSSSGTLNATGSAQNQYVFFDSLHPTAQTHSLLASDVQSSMTQVFGTPQTAQAQTSSPSRSSGSSVASDFNGDGKSDVLFQNDNGSVGIWNMNGTTIIGSAVVSAAPVSWHVEGSGDFNGDGKSDVVLQNDNGSVAIWEMNGMAIIGSALVSPAPVSWHVKGTGDFSGDGNSDIVLQNDDGSVAIWTMNGTTITGSALISTPASSWHVVGTGDFNGDGKSDIVLQNDNGSVGIWDMNGMTITGSALISTPAPSWHVVGTGDFNGDGKSDIVLQNDNGSVGIWEMNGMTIIASALVSTPAPSWHVKGTGDYNGDGKSDILLQNDDGSIATWEMNGTTIINSALISTAPASWHAIGSDTMQFIDAGSAATVSATSQSEEFVLTSFTAGSHTITGFDPSQDLIALSKASFSDFASVEANATASGGGTMIALNSNSSLLLAGVTRADLHSSNFVFS